jgi:hypothetical protein
MQVCPCRSIQCSNPAFTRRHGRGFVLLFQWRQIVARLTPWITTNATAALKRAPKFDSNQYRLAFMQKRDSKAGRLELFGRQWRKSVVAVTQCAALRDRIWPISVNTHLATKLQRARLTSTPAPCWPTPQRPCVLWPTAVPGSWPARLPPPGGRSPTVACPQASG